MPASTTLPEAVVFIARHWGGEGIIPVRRGVTYGRRDVDGGRQRIPAGWSFSADGFTYHVFQRDDGDWAWTDGSPWGSYAIVRERPTYWSVDNGFELKQVLK